MSLSRIEIFHKEYIKAITEFDISSVTEESSEEALLKFRKVFKPEDLIILSEFADFTRVANKIELMLVDEAGGMDLGLASIIQMRAKYAIDKGNELVVISLSEFANRLKVDEAFMVFKVNKLSFLHHGSSERFPFVEKIATYIKALPDLTEIVLRGCGNAEEPSQTEKKVYEVKIGPSYEKKAMIQGDNQLIVQQKKEHDGTIHTKLSWRAYDSEKNKSVLQEILINDIAQITGNILNDAVLKSLEHIDGVPLLKRTGLDVHSYRERFFNTHQPMSAQDLADTKRVLRRARTEESELMSLQDDVLSKIVNNMTIDQRYKISVKAYVGGYNVYHGRVIPIHEHGHGGEPKAMRIGQKQKHR